MTSGQGCILEKISERATAEIWGEEGGFSLSTLPWEWYPFLFFGGKWARERVLDP